MKTKSETIGNLLRDNNVILILGAFLIFAIVSVENFTKVVNLQNLFVNVGFYGVVAIGMTFVLLTGAVDLSMGLNVACSAIVCIITMNASGSIPLGFLAAIATGVFIGFLNGQIINVMGLNPLIATLAMMITLRGVCLLLTNGESVIATNPNYMALYTGSTFGIRNPILWCALLLVAAYLFLTKTRLGNSIYVLGGNMEAGRMAGINMLRVRLIVYMLVGLFAGLGGFVIGARSATGSVLLVENLNIDVISSCVIGGIKISGGKGNVLKMILGVFLIQTLTNVLSLKGIIGSWQTLITGAVLVAVLILDRATQRKQSGFAAMR